MASPNQPVQVVHTMVMVRENTGWEIWIKALFKKYKNDGKTITNNETTIKKKLSKSTHKWTLHNNCILQY